MKSLWNYIEDCDTLILKKSPIIFSPQLQRKNGMCKCSSEEHLANPKTCRCFYLDLELHTNFYQNIWILLQYFEVQLHTYKNFQVSLTCAADPDASCYCGETGGDPQPRIMEGEAATIRETPWVVRLWLLSKVGNRSSFAAKRWVLQREWKKSVYTLHVVLILPILRDGLFLGKTLFTGMGTGYSVPSFATHINTPTHPCPLQL